MSPLPAGTVAYRYVDSESVWEGGPADLQEPTGISLATGLLQPVRQPDRVGPAL